MTGTSVSRTERLLNLVIALLSTRAPLSRATIQSSVAGYDSGATVAAFERMFERDKEELRAMGVPIRTIADAHGEVQGYTIDADEYATRDVNFTVEELAVLNVAAQLWDNAVLESSALTAVRKLESIADETAPAPVGTFGVLTARDAALLPLLRAVRDRRIVRFDYGKPGADEVALRVVAPWAVRSRNGHWYMLGWDAERGEQRVFRLSRIRGQVQITAAESPRRSSDRVEDWTVDIDDDVTAELEIPEGMGAEIRRLPSARSADGVWFTVEGSRQQLLTLLWRADPRVRIQQPADLIDDYRAGLEAIERLHS